MTDGRFIVIEGLDASGKETQAELLVNRLQDNGQDVFFQSFPAYDKTEAGQKLREYLQSDAASELTSEALAELYIEDRKQMQDRLRQALDAGKIVIADRYAQSNYAYQTAHMSQEERWAFIDWLKQQEQDLPQPDRVLYIDMPVRQCLELMQLQNRAKDKHEQDVAYLRKVAAAYREIAEQEGWTRIDPLEHGWSHHEITATERLRPPEEIHNDVWRAVKPVLPDT